MQAIALIRDASQYDDVALAVSWSGDVREANVVERVIYGIIDFFDAGAPERRRNEAREAVKTKLCHEYTVLAGPALPNQPFVLTEEIKNAISTVASTLIDQGILPKNNMPANLSDALKNINAISKESDASRRLIWQAIADQRKEKKKSVLMPQRISLPIRDFGDNPCISVRVMRSASPVMPGSFMKKRRSCQKRVKTFCSAQVV